MGKGYFKIWHKIEDWEWWGDLTMMGFWLYLLKKANIKEKRWRGSTVKRGQFISSRASMAEDLDISEQQIRTMVSRLKSTSELTSESTNQYTLYTIVNYDKYQKKFAEVTDESTSEATSKQPASNQRATTTKECKNVRKKDICDSKDKPSRTEVLKVISHYRQSYKHRLGIDYPTVRGKDYVLVRDVVADYGAEVANRLVDLHWDNDWIQKNGSSIGKFKSVLTSLLPQLKQKREVKQWRKPSRLTLKEKMELEERGLKQDEPGVG